MAATNTSALFAWLLVASLLLPVAGCGGDGDGSRAADQSGAVWRVDPTPIFTLADTGDDDEVLIGLAEGVTRLPNGDVLVADRGLFSLRWFAPDGTLKKSLGREGSGPNEFRYIAQMFRCGDVVYVNDLGRGQLYQGFTLDGEARGTVTLSSPSLRGSYSNRCNATGQWVAMEWEDLNGMPLGRQRPLVGYWLAGADGSVLVSLGDFPGSERFVEPGGNSGPHPLGKEPVLAIGRDRAYVGSADSFVVQAFNLDGAPAGTLRDTSANLTTTADDITRFKYCDTLGIEAMWRESTIRQWSLVDFPPTVPAYDAMLVDADDLVWIRRYPRGIGDDVQWLVFQSDGTKVATVTLPQTFAVHEIGTDYIAGIAAHPVDGTQSVQVYALQRAW